jgi:hypothetical protein
LVLVYIHEWGISSIFGSDDLVRSTGVFALCLDLFLFDISAIQTRNIFVQITVINQHERGVIIWSQQNISARPA